MTIAAANTTRTTVVMIRPHGVCFWLTIDLPGLRAGGRAVAVLAGAFVVPLEFARAPGFFAGGLGGLRWAMRLHSHCQCGSGPVRTAIRAGRRQRDGPPTGPSLSADPMICLGGDVGPEFRCPRPHYDCAVPPSELSPAVLAAVAGC